MFSLNNISLQFSGVEIFNNVTLIINKRDRIGLVGKNGAGKTTLLRLLYGMQKPDAGSISIPQNTSVGFLPQEVSFKGTQSVFEETLNAFEKIKSLKETIDRCNKLLHNLTDFHSDTYAHTISLLNNANEQFALLGGYTVDAETEKILLGLGFDSSQLHLPVGTFSGGWRMRIELAKILLQKPDLLLLDEPTNHLDIESIQWLEEFLLKYPGAVIIVSHDRTLLDNISLRTVEINYGRLYDYDVPYSLYIKKRDERIAQQQAEYENQQKFIDQTEKFIERFRYKATKAKQVQSRVKMLEKLEKVEVDLIDESSIYFRFPPAPSSGKVVIEAENLSKKYDNKVVLSQIDFLIDKGDKIAFVGKNGEGKTTLSRIIVGDLSCEGLCKTGYNVALGYYAQNETELLNPDKTVFETIDDVAVGEIRPKIRNILGAFLFGGDAIEKKVKVLSGGEKSRLALARLLLKPVNLLVLDEPTNHLDMKAKDILKKALMQYDGTLIIVSHDRYFLQGLTNKVFEFKNQKIKQYLGDVNDFLKSRNINTLSQLQAPPSSPLPSSQNDKNPSQNKINREKKKEADRQLRKIKNIIARFEDDITSVEAQLKDLEHQLANPNQSLSATAYADLFKTHENLKQKLDSLVHLWTEAHEEHDALNAEYFS
ncbi:MAG: putative ABC transporter ATP-binding protein YheS [Bacteroidetes bacterium ADurb.Bin408]|nr:MAG: putative ABC transporter ATP-binding protein YheS [Bacteroidetes bacterium ADurb.Bin408]